jgi:hypothetical protein
MLRKMVVCAVALVLCASAQAQVSLSGGGSTVKRKADSKFKLYSTETPETASSIGGTVGGGRIVNLFAVPIRASGEGHTNDVNAAIQEVFTTRQSSRAVDYFRSESFVSNMTMLLIFDISAGTNETIAATDTEFTVSSTDTNTATPNLWGDSITFNATQGYDTNDFIGVRTDGEVFPTHTPLSTQTKRIVGGILLKHLSQTDNDTLSWFHGYVNANPELQIKVTPKVRGTFAPTLTLTKGPPRLKLTMDENGDLTLRVEGLVDTTVYTLQGTGDVGDPTSWVDLRPTSGGQSFPFGSVTNATMRFYRLVYK